MTSYWQAGDERRKRAARYVKIIRGLLRIAKIAMPDTYYESDRRVRAAKKLLKELT